ncbi:MAG: HEAT repeat domain-containing protein, partial [Planctomycetes bacterium]|nr:HEAT repeat domain-containing protein [Planctomycetota bacterium]
MLLRITRAFFAVACAFAVVFTAATLSPNAPVVMAQDALGTTKEGLREYKKGNWEEAIKKFDAALAADPTDEDARRIRDEIGAELARDFIENNFRNPGLSGRFARFGKWVMTGLGKDAYKGRNNDPEQIAKFVDAYMSDADTTRNLLRAASIRDSYGDFAVPYIQANYMHSDNADYRYRARLLLATLGAQAVNAIVQCFYSAEMYDRQTAALALGDIRDARAMPILAKHFQDKNEEEQVREACRAAIEWIRADNPEQDKKVNNAKDLFYLQAEGIYRNNAAGRYYRNRLVGTTYQGQLPVAMYGYDRSYTIWKWIPSESGDGELVSQEVPLWAFADIMAEESALQAFELGVMQAGGNASSDAFTKDAQALLSCIHMHMYTEGRGRIYN